MICPINHHPREYVVYSTEPLTQGVLLLDVLRAHVDSQAPPPETEKEVSKIKTKKTIVMIESQV